MERINNNYIKVTKPDIFLQIAKESDSNNSSKLAYFEDLITTILEYEKENNDHIYDIFLPISDFNEIDLLYIPIKRQTIINAYLFANMNNELALSIKLKGLIAKKELNLKELGNLEIYILNHSMDLNEYIDGEAIRTIYNSKENKLENGYIFNCEESKIKTKKENF